MEKSGPIYHLLLTLSHPFYNHRILDEQIYNLHFSTIHYLLYLKLLQIFREVHKEPSQK
ncbi:245R [Invertebrate iridescent virus Kaz2018]|uniref:245R n=1 Tax=Invertebrate iridescent virus 6 TaxID=176652 RepID=Q91FS7_IIV6|nr:245R [Invertebrate iridescent virus 6]AAK82106.1 245R [Invertebrate iridescent virus 6]QMS79690.1 hypothetical protein IIV6-T1_240 [Invertebrate iridescent virus 6]QNH08655.1 245R [Invertebrate iridescent virus Kaz2018]